MDWLERKVINQVINSGKFLPLNKGTTRLQQVIAPLRWYCPNANSIKNNGSAPNNNIVVYGIKNTPFDLNLKKKQNRIF